jgi:DNA polymerase I
MTKRLAVIDGKSIFYRGYYAMPSLSLEDGTPTGGVYGFAALAIELIKKLKPDYVAVAWDKQGTNIRKRREIYPEYKANRKKAPDDFYAQIPILCELLEAFGWPLYELDDYEADDIMGAFAKQATEKGIETYLLTSDLDALQVVSPMVKVFALKNGLSNIEEFDVEYFEKKYGIGVEQFLDLKALKGDSSDNLPGVSGVGEKIATELLQQYSTLDNIYEHLDEIKPTVAKKLADGKKMAYMCKEIARTWVDAPVKLDWDVADVNDTNIDQVAEILKRLEFFSLIRKLPDHMKITSEKTISIPNKPSLEPLKIIDWPETLKIDGPILIHIDEDELWLSTDKQTVSHQKINQIDNVIWKSFELSTVVAFDIKSVYHQLADREVMVEFNEIHDIHQAAFLIDPLRRDQSLSGLIGQELSNDVAEKMAAMWHVYGQQINAFNIEPKLVRIATDFDFPLTYILFKMERRGVKLDKQALDLMSVELTAEYKKIEQEIYDMVGYEFNIASPQQLSDVLFGKLTLPAAGIKKGKTGYSTGQKELDKLRGKHPIIELIEKSRELAKLINTYVDTLPLLIGEDGRIHTTYNQDIASTGRLSSTNPNLQNIPIRSAEGRRIRAAFVPERGNLFVSADYSQFELRLAAVMANDKALVDDFNSGVDIHSKTASEVYGVPLESVTKDQRRNAKVINFGILYGMSPHGLSAATSMTFIEAKKFIDEYFELRKPIRKYLNDILAKARNEGFAETYFGRRRPTPDILSSNYMVRSGAERAAANMPIQGTEADLMKLAMIEIDKKITGLGEQILQVHDSIIIECPAENAGDISEMLRHTLENIAPELKIKLQVDVSLGESWGEL